MKKDTIVIKIDEKNIIDEALDIPAQTIKNGGLVAFPTETVYGLGANALDEQAVSEIFIAKGRPSDNPLIVHICDLSQLEQLVYEIPKKAHILMEKFWPGPLTLLFKKSEIVPMVTSGGLSTVAVRMPNSEIALSLIKKTNLPIAGPSANTSGRPSPTSAEHVIEDLDGKIDVVIDGGMTGIGIESTVLDLTCQVPMILRPGGVTYEELVEVIGDVEYDPAVETLNNNVKPKSPGQKYRHYSPKANMEIFSGDIDRVIQKINEKACEYSEKKLNVGIIATDQTVNNYKINNCKTQNIISIGSRNKPETIATNLFNVLRKFDKLNVDIILSEGVEEVDIGKAIMNRMKKAAGGNIIYLK